MRCSNLLVIAAIGFVTTGCGFMGPAVSPIGNNTYMASGGSMYGNNSFAYNTCAKQGKQLKVLSMENRDPGGNVIFTCMSPSDPGYNKPAQFEPVPNVIIQDNRR